MIQHVSLKIEPKRRKGQHRLPNQHVSESRRMRSVKNGRLTQKLFSEALDILYLLAAPSKKSYWQVRKLEQQLRQNARQQLERQLAQQLVRQESLTKGRLPEMSWSGTRAACWLGKSSIMGSGQEAKNVMLISDSSSRASFCCLLTVQSLGQYCPGRCKTAAVCPEYPLVVSCSHQKIAGTLERAGATETLVKHHAFEMNIHSATFSKAIKSETRTALSAHRARRPDVQPRSDA